MDEEILILTNIISEILNEEMSDIKKINKLASKNNICNLSEEDLLSKEIIALKDLLLEIKDKKFTELSIVDKVDAYYLLSEINTLNKKIIVLLDKNKGIWEII